jgi:RNA polymerase sigma factor (sigma-70 family)
MVTDDLKELVLRAQRGDIEAFAVLVRRYQGMAVGYAYAKLGDFHLAEDAAQEAFIDAYQLIGDLRVADAFPGWLKRIVFKHSDRLTRRRPEQVSLEKVDEPLAAEADTTTALERAEGQRQVREAIAALPAAQRQVVSLFYIQRHSQSEIAAFLEVPLTTVKKRLHDARRKLREGMLDMVSETLRENGPDELFSQKIIAGLRARPRLLEIAEHPLRRAWEQVQRALPEWEVIDGDEVVDTRLYDAVQQQMDVAGMAYQIDEERILRTHMTHTMFQAAAGRTPPVYLLAAGRCFRPDAEDAKHQKVFHQVEGLCIDVGVGRAEMEAAATHVLQSILGEPNAYWQARDFGFVEDGCEIEIEYKGRRIGVGGCGLLRPDMLREAGFHSTQVCGYAFGMGLERLVMIARDIEDIRDLWRAPYV